MSSARVIDAYAAVLTRLFERTVDIVQSLPPAGVIQTSYEEKLALYGDAWEMQRGYTAQEAKQLYVESMLKILRRFGDRPQAISLIADLEAYSGDVAEQVMSGTLAETASIHSSSIASPSPQSYADEATSSVADEDIREIALRHRVRGSDANTASGSNSHDTVTGSDMPREPEPEPEPEASRRVPSRRARISDVSQKRQNTRTPRVSRGQSLRAVQPTHSHTFSHAPSQSAAATTTAAPASVSARSDAASYSFASAQATDARSVAGSVSRSVRSGPMGRYAGSASGRSAARAPPVQPPARAPAPAAPSTSSAAPRPELDQALRDIQSSLTTLNERLSRAESSLAAPKEPARPAGALSSKELLTLLFRKTSDASSQALYDIAAVLGVVNPRVEGDISAPSYDEWLAARTSGSLSGTKRRPNIWQRLVRAPLTMASLVFRLLLDLASLMVLMSMALALLRRVTGRGDPWIVLRLLNRIGVSTLSSAANRRATLRVILASALAGGFMLESSRVST
ncbi:hypothetical protein MCUN1_002124 [Malassezia cuniculi]|uniref:Uncharacterized protein n=1 Tax=Malassezia cuniculi TaxID=948313 RepID=A0AAF0EZ55_9BASI|nr:hypothetical protein MCUN1_002124 [Malassezia cuniculi]